MPKFIATEVEVISRQTNNGQLKSEELEYKVTLISSGDTREMKIDEIAKKILQMLQDVNLD